MLDRNTPEYQQQIESNLGIAIEMMTADQQRRIRELQKEIREAQFLQKAMFNSFADRHLESEVKMTV
jgi:hypothetical protein